MSRKTKLRSQYDYRLIATTLEGDSDTLWVNIACVIGATSAQLFTEQAGFLAMQKGQLCPVIAFKNIQTHISLLARRPFSPDKSTSDY